MLTMNEKRPKVTFDVPERIRRTLAIIAAEQNCSVGDVIERLVIRNHPTQLERADRAIAEGEITPPPKRGRKPKQP